MSTLAVTRRAVYVGTLVPLLLLAAMYAQGVTYLVLVWSRDQNYGHGFFIPLISAYLIWADRERLRTMRWHGSWWGVAVVAAGLGFYFVGELATLYVLLHVSLWLVLVGMVLAAGGWPVMRAVAFPLGLLLVVIPLPDFLYQGLSGRLQLLSSQLGVGLLDAFEVSALREGNVIDLGTTQLQVVEACSGLRYLFPLTTLALIGAYLVFDRPWKRIALVLLSVPIAVGLNVFRIAATGMLVDRYGVELAEGFFHAFSGWLVFVCGLALVGAAAWALRARGIASTAPAPAGPSRETADAGPRRPARAYLASLVLLSAALLGAAGVSGREETPPPRELLTEFPLTIDGWVGRSVPMATVYVDELRFDDYLLADFRRDTAPPVNLYVAYYASQRKKQSIHSPRSCLPGGGWEIVSVQRAEALTDGPQPFAVNRALIQKGASKQVVWYWFEGRGRSLTSEYLVKWYLLWDGVTRNRTDGALVRVVAPLAPGEAESAADRRIAALVGSARPLMARFIP
jgi:exosortase D (VPLPA-CTERM-specific)